jgi:hypothetical protein
VSEEEEKKIQAKADKYCDGNVSEWLRLAAVMYEPPTDLKSQQ